ncbi:MAG TPA: 3-deoxy-7-phosphoheptulonate synthase [Spirochaetota bacterium]|nr:3-deoxy-7-phosphoheptulonate synthase [Spirochaetota bacterium]HRZ26660.1 3-deoxy-7-phosphoheptulonate synthase [Spirochaetota bacterium]HSA16709.1 3-deoxy-7-phosphoheptulonate synthase [Spirochaetota bacterium]
MGIIYIQKIPSVDEILDAIPMSEELKYLKKQRDMDIQNIFQGKDKRFLLIIGPCSAHDEDAVCDYVSRLARIQEKVASEILIIPRIYTNKPRTTGTGYKGMLHQPNHHKKPDLALGIKAIRNMHIRSFRESHLSAADEMLYPGNYPYLADILAYVAIGARSVENQQHRLTVSGLDIPVGMKNPTSGDIRVMLDSICAAQTPHVFIYNEWEVSTTGNTLAHAVLRGSVDRYGNHSPNYHYDDLVEVIKLYHERKLQNPVIIVDTNHSNSGKKYKEQIRISKEIMLNRKHAARLRTAIKGLMIESYILEGAQGPDGDEYGRSITDPCLGWEDTERLILDLAEMNG